MPTINDARSWRGQDLVDADGGRIGSIEEIYVDSDTDQVEWALVTTGLFASKQSFVPLDGASETADGISVPFDTGTVKDAPKIDPDGRLSQREEAELYRHYGREYSAPRSDSGLPEGTAATGTHDDDGEHGGPGRDLSGPNTDDAIARSEEELHVGTTEREAGRVRLKKYVVEDEVTQTVPVRREEVRVEREPITDADRDAALDGPAISEEEHGVVLHAEEPVAEKHAVPKERVRLEKAVETDEREVSETVRKERIHVDDAR